MNSGSLIFLNTEITASYPFLYIYGRLEDGRSICAKTSNFHHYFYVYLGDHPFPDDLNGTIHEAANFGKLDDGIYIKSVDQVYRKSVMGYQPDGPVLMYKITMISYKHVSICQRIFEARGFLTYEASIKYELRFMVDKLFGGYDWLTIGKHWPPHTRQSHCAIEVEFDSNSLEKLPGNRSDYHQTIVLAFDIEACKGGNGRGFVNATEDAVCQIGNTLYDGNYQILDRRVFSLVPIGKHVTSLEPKIKVEEFEDERHLLLAWIHYIVRRDPDILTGYNIKMFDEPYLFDRAKALGILDEFVQMGKLVAKRATIRKTAFNSAGKGARLDYSVAIDGRFDFDMIKSIKEQFDLKLRSYSLGSVAKHVLGYQKVEMPYQNIPIYQAGTDDQRSHLCYYCWWDAELCYELMKKRMTLVNYIEAARVCGTPLKYFLDRGQQIHTTSLFLRYANPRNFLIPSSTESQNDEDTAGATVLEPLAGFYEDPVVTLDFRSLYPSIIEDSNICYSTKAPTKWARANLQPADYVIPPNTSGEFCFVADRIMQGILPQMEQVLFAKRNEAKDQMKKEQNSNKKNVYNCKQNAIKVRMNSIYGFLKANTVCDKDLMEAVTGTGRFMLEASKELVEREFPGAKVVYGDSVTGDTPCLLYDLERKWIIVKTIESLTDEFVTGGEDGKEYGMAIKYLVWTETGWTGIRRVMRHLTNKPIVRVLTHTGVVDCTTDHGLVKADGMRASPNVLHIGDELLHSFCEWSVTGRVHLSIEHAVEYAKDVISPPDMILNASLDIRRIFWKEFKKHNLRMTFVDKIDAMRTFTLMRSIGKNDTTIAVHLNLYHVQKSSEHHRNLEIVEIQPIDTIDGATVYDLETENHHFHAGVGQLIVHNTDSIFIHFGKVSVEEAFALGAKAATMCTEMFHKRSGKKVHLLQMEKLFKPFLLIGKKKYTGFKCLELGKPFKRDETGLENVRRDNALIGSETLDNVARMIIEEGDYTAERSIQYVHSEIRELLMGRIPLSKLIISKNLSKSFKHYEEKGTMQPHVELAKKIAARAHITGEQLYYTGDRVPFVMLADLDGTKSALRAEDPLYALEHRLSIDYRYYIENQMMRPLLRLLTPILAPQQYRLAKGVGKNAFDVLLATRVGENVKKRNKKGDKVNLNANELRGLTAYKALFVGSHMMSTIQKVNLDVKTAGTITSFAKKLDTCLNCKCGIRDKRGRNGDIVDGGHLCGPCEPKRPLVHIKLQMELNHLEVKKWKTWTECQRCDKKLHGEVVCANKDCSNFYERTKVEVDLEDLQKKLS
jgi:DNA polymerase elongation subunit (family B)